MKKIRGKLTYANVMATIAVFIALGGVSYAATQLPKNSVGSKQLKKGSVTPAKLSKASKKTLTGVVGRDGATGAQGPKGEKGEAGTAAPVGGTLPSGKTVVGAYGFGTGDAGTPSDGITFGGYRLSAAPAVHYIKEGEANPPGCTGTPLNPIADPGNLCVFEWVTHGGLSTNRNVVNPVTDDLGSATTFGAVAFAQCTAECYVYGTWVVTAP
jgi:hypothetical protein